jgi:RNA polymerase sigma-32 factor
LVPSLGNLDAYISAVNRLPLLTAEEESAAARSLRDQGDLEAAGRLVLSHLRLVVSISRQYLGYGLPLVPSLGREPRVTVAVSDLPPRR